MKPIEFYTTPEGEVTMRPLGEAERQLRESDTEFIQAFSGHRTKRIKRYIE